MCIENSFKLFLCWAPLHLGHVQVAKQRPRVRVVVTELFLLIFTSAIMLIYYANTFLHYSSIQKKGSSFITLVRQMFLLQQGEVKMRSSHEIAGQVIMCLNINLKLTLIFIQKCLNLLLTLETMANQSINYTN